MTFLIDTSVLKRLGNSEIRDVVEPLAARGLISRPRICDLEVGFSARTAKEWDSLIAALDVFPAVETTQRHFRRALQVQRLLAAKSQRGRKIPDLLVAAAAEEMELTVLHYDADFDLIANVTGQSTAWVTEPGNVD